MHGDRRPIQDPLGARQSGWQRHEVFAQRRTHLGHCRTDVAETVEYRVQDEGIGLEAREVETIFERYGRGDTALQHGIRGHGLGLFICRRIAESHGGTIFARPRTTGSSFTLVLPIHQTGA